MKTVREKALERALKTILKKCEKIASACEAGIDGDQEEALEKIYNLLPNQTAYDKLIGK